MANPYYMYNLKALYETLQAALLFWKLQSEILQERGFILNPYDKFIAIKLSMYEYIEKMLTELPANMEGLVTASASSYLFNKDTGCKKLCEEQGQWFHHLVAKLLYLSK